MKILALERPGSATMEQHAPHLEQGTAYPRAADASVGVCAGLQGLSALADGQKH